MHDEAYDQLLAATPPGWYVGTPSYHDERREWVMYAFDPSEIGRDLGRVMIRSTTDALAYLFGVSGTERNFDRWTAAIAPALSLGAAAIHFSVVGAHFAEYPPFGVLFAGLAWFQVGWALWFAVRPDRALALIALVVSVGVIFVWFTSRTTGLPIGPEPWVAEPVGVRDAVATTMEVALVSLLAWSTVATRGRPAREPGMSSAGVVAATSLLVVALITSAVLITAGDTEHSTDQHPPAGSGVIDARSHDRG